MVVSIIYLFIFVCVYYNDVTCGMSRGTFIDVKKGTEGQ